MHAVIAFACGLLFGIGLVVSGMTDPAKVQAFLDIGGVWDPSLAVVMAAALAVAAPGFALARRMDAPLCGGKFQLPTRHDVDWPLLAGAALFGAGWGLAGLCPGPALAGLASGQGQVLAFVAAMVAGMAAARLVRR